MGDDAERTCPLCMEEMDLTDQQLKPCKCGYEICVWCWHHIMDMAEKDDTEGRCPACRTPYDKERIVGMTVSSERLAEINNEKKQKSQKAKSKTSEGRKHLSTVRVIQRNLVYIVGIPANLADEETLQRKEYFGQYGKILKVSITRTGGAAQHSSNNSCSVYITYSKNEEAIRCIQVVNGFVLDGRSLRACFGTTKYCHAWLRNMPCGNPDCLYLHDAGTQEDTFTKDEAISTCASKIQHSVASSLSNIHQRAGSFLPPPIDNFCGNNAISSSKTLIRPVLHTTGMHGKSSLLNGETGKSCGLPAAAAWGVRVNPSASSATCAEVCLGMSKHKPNVCSSLTASVGRDAQLPTQTWEQETHAEYIVASRNQRLLGSSKTDSFPMPKPDKDCNLENRQAESTVETKVAVKSSVCESACLSSNGEVGRVNSVPNSLDSSGLVRQVSNSLSSNEIVGHPIVEDNIIQSSASRLHLATNETSTSSRTSNGGRNTMSFSQPRIDTRPSEQSSISSQENLKPSMEGLVVGATLRDTSTSETVHYPGEESGLSSKMGVNMSPAKNRDGRNVFSASADLSSLPMHGCVAEPVVEDCSVTASNLSISPKREQEKLSSEACGHLDDIQSTYSANGPQNLTLLERHVNQDSSALEEPKADDGENSIITDILSLDIGLDDPLASPSIARLLHGSSDKTAGYSRLLNPWKSTSNNESRFSFARMDDSNQETGHSFLLDISKSWQGENSRLQDSYVNQGVQANRFRNGIALTVSDESDVLSSQHQLSSGGAMAPLSLLSRPEDIPPPKSSIQRKAPPVPPPGFYPQHAMDRDQYSSVLRSPGSAAQYQFIGSSAGLSLPQQTVGNGSYADVEFIDPAIMAVSGGKLPLPMTHQISPSYSSNMLAGFPEMDQRLQLLKSRSSNLNQNSLITSDQSKWSLLQDLALQEAIRTPNGSWGSSWGMGNQTSIESGLLGRRGQSSLAEITNGGRMGYLDSQYGFLRPYPAHEDTKFQASNSSHFYNSAYDM